MRQKESGGRDAESSPRHGFEREAIVADGEERIRVELFGGPRVYSGDSEIGQFPTQYSAGLLTLLALEPGKHFDRDDLARALWPDEEPSATRHRLREALYRLRQKNPALADVIKSGKDSIWFATDSAVFVEAVEFDRLMAEARTAETERRADVLREAASLYKGALCPGLPGPRFEAVRERYAALHRECERMEAAVKDRAEKEADARRAARIKILRAACATAGCAVMVVALLWSWDRIHAAGPPLSPDQRVALIERLQIAPKTDATRRELALQCVALGEEAWKAWYGRDEQIWMDRLRRIEPEIDSSFDWLLKHDPDHGLQLSGAIMRFWYLNGESSHAGAALEFALRVAARGRTGYRARTLVGRSLTLLGGTEDERHTGMRCADEALAIYTRLGDWWGQGHAWRHIGLLHNSFHDSDLAAESTENSLSCFDRVAGPNGLSGRACSLYCVSMMGKTGATREESITTRKRCSLQALRLFREVGNDWGIRESYNHLVESPGPEDPTVGDSAYWREFQEGCLAQVHWQEARANFNEVNAAWREYLAISWRLKDDAGVVEALGRLASTPPDLNLRVTLWGAYFRNMHLLRHPPYPPRVALGAVDDNANLMPRLAAGRCFNRGRRMLPAEAARFALAALQVPGFTER